MLYASEGKQFKVCELSIGGIEVNGEGEITWIEIEEFEGIPLTEEWLLKFGFSGALYYFKSGFEFSLKKQSDGFVMIINDYEECWPEIQYVHQLQNLYFALTGEELTIKE